MSDNNGSTSTNSTNSGSGIAPKENTDNEKKMTGANLLKDASNPEKPAEGKTPPDSGSGITPKANEEKMTGIYLAKKENEESKDNNNMEFFIGSLDKEELVKIDGITAISESAFANSDAENILLSSCSSGCYTIGKSAFENCDKLKTVIFEEQGEKDKQATSILKNVKLDSAVADDFTIQTNAFKGCSSLTTLILPKVSDDKTLTIEKDAFSGCEKLRTVVAVCGNADFTENPFSGCPEHLTFVCKKDPNKKDSDVARFARENGYRSVYVD